MKIGTLSGPYSLTYYKGEQTAKQLLDWDLQMTKWADQYGYNEVYFTEHYTIGSEPSPAPDLMIAAASQITENVTLGAMGHLVPYHNPAALAFRLMWLDHMTGGRYIAGVAPGSFPSDAQVFGTNGNNAEMLYEGLDVMTKIWTQKGPFVHEGKYYKVDMPGYDDLWHGPHLTPFQSPHPRIAIAGNSPRSIGHIEAGKRGLIPFSQQSSATTLRSHWETYSEAAEEAGHTPDRADWRILRDAFVADTDAEARSAMLNGAHGKFWRQHLLPLFKKFGLAGALLEPGQTAEDLTVEYLVDNVFLVGSPETVAAKARKLHDDVGGFGTLVMSVHDYSATPEVLQHSMELMGTEVAPLLRDLELSSNRA